LAGWRQGHVHAVVVQFSPALFSESWLEKGCMTKVKKLLQRARFGLRVSGSTRDRATRLMGRIAQTRGLERFVCLIQLLSLLAASGDLLQLAAADFKLGGRGATLDRLGTVCKYIEDHFCEPLYLADLAKRGGVSESTFRRLLKQGTGRTLPEYINELRIAHACRLLAETDRTASEIAHQCGFVTDTHFQCAFRKLQNQTPLAYRQMVRRGT
jgi:AraC-like DNA-binding protein